MMHLTLEQLASDFLTSRTTIKHNKKYWNLYSSPYTKGQSKEVLRPYPHIQDSQRKELLFAVVEDKDRDDKEVNDQIFFKSLT